MAWRELLKNQNAVKNTVAQHGSPSVPHVSMPNVTGWRDHYKVAQLHSHVIAGHVGSLLAAHLTDNPEHQAKLASAISGSMLK